VTHSKFGFSMKGGTRMALRVSCCSLICILVVIAISRPARAVVLLHDQFLEDGGLEGKTPMPGPPGPNLKPWNAGSGGGVNPTQVVNGEVVLVQVDSTPVLINGEDQANDFGEQGATATTFAGFDFRLPAADNAMLATDPSVADGMFFISLRAQSPASSLRARTGVMPPAAGGDFRLAINADDNDLSLGAIWSGELEFDTTYRAVISYNATNAVSQLWLNPVNESSTSVTHTGLLTGTDIDRIVLRQHTDYTGKQIVDNLIVATTFAEALGVDDSANGDFNGDGVVDAADYVMWRKNGGTTDDYALWQETFGEPTGGGSSSTTSVPEPASRLVLMLCASMLAAMNRAARFPFAASCGSLHLQIAD
jgi:hypothetical protein